jgi:hypothetical protein
MNANVSEIDVCLSDIFKYLTQAIDGLENEQGWKLLESAAALKTVVDALNAVLDSSEERFDITFPTGTIKERHLSSDFFKEAEHVS